jgi:hypothetical protein
VQHQQQEQNHMTQVNSKTHPELFAAMDAAAAQYWAYPDTEWQDDFIDAWLESHPEQDSAEGY